MSGGARVRRSAGRPGDGRRASGAAALHSVRYNERSQPEVLREGAPVFRPASLPAGERNSRRHSLPRRAAAKPHTANRAESRGRPGASVSDRHRAAARNPHQRRRPPPISRLQTHASPTAQNHGDMERRPVLPVGASDRHRAGARNLHRRRRATPISRLRTHASPTAQNHGDMERWPVLPVGASDRHRAGARNPHRRRFARPT